MPVEPELKLSRAGEFATPITNRSFFKTIARRNLNDVRAIYQEPKDAHTQYFRGKMSAPMASEIHPVIIDSLSAISGIKTCDKVMARYENVSLRASIKAGLADHMIAEGHLRRLLLLGQK